ncbi:MAG TPA: histidine kinase [Candidatus Dormibacteraeota bacterium]
MKAVGRPEGGGLATAAAVAGALATATLTAGAWLLAVRNGDTNPLTGNHGPDLIVPVGITAVGAVVVARRRWNPLGWLLLLSGVVDALRSASGEYAVRGLSAPGTLPAVDWAAWLTNWLLGVIFPAGTLLFIFLLFPTGRLLSRRWRPVAVAAVTLTVFTTFVSIVSPTSTTLQSHALPAPNPLAIAGFPLTEDDAGWVWPAGILLLLVAAASPLIRYRRADGEERQQIKWFAFAVLATVVLIIATLPVSAGLPAGEASVLFNLVIIAGIGFALPAAIGLAILKYRLYGIDVVIGRTLVYGSLAVLITGVYVGIAVGVGELVGSGGKPNLGLSILATAIVAIGFQPARERLQRIANRLVYGRRATPYQVLSKFSSQVAGSYAADDVLPRMARVLHEGTGAESTAVWLRAGSVLHPAASWPDSALTALPRDVAVNGVLPDLGGATRAVEVRHQGELLGALTVVKRRGEALTPVEEKLVDDLAHQAGLVLKNVGLTADLQRRLEELRQSRQRLVSAQDQERRRLERNLHDGAQQTLVALKVKLGLADMLMAKDPEKAKQTIAQLKADTDEALETLRDLARGIYPPLLAEKGLAAALESQARKATLPVRVDAGGIGRYPQEVEATVYFCVLEALQNVQRYADATSASVRLRGSDGELRFEVADDGRGFDVESAKSGAGLSNMRDRVDALDGDFAIVSAPKQGARVIGRLPLLAPARAG